MNRQDLNFIADQPIDDPIVAVKDFPNFFTIRLWYNSANLWKRFQC